MRVEAAGQTRQGSEREVNRDALLIRHELGLYAVADSVGKGAWKTSPAEMALTCLAELSAACPPFSDPDVETAVRKAVLRTNDVLINEAEKDPGRAGATTLTCCFVKDDVCLVAHLGDSVAWLISDGLARRVTPEDTLAGLLLEKHLITASDARRHPGRNMVLGVLGKDREPTPATRRLSVREGDFIVLTTDGVARAVSEKRMCEEATRKDRQFRSLAKRLVSAASQAGATDDLTAVVLSFHA